MRAENQRLLQLILEIRSSSSSFFCFDTVCSAFLTDFAFKAALPANPQPPQPPHPLPTEGMVPFFCIRTDQSHISYSFLYCCRADETLDRLRDGTRPRLFPPPLFITSDKARPCVGTINPTNRRNRDEITKHPLKELSVSDPKRQKQRENASDSSLMTLRDIMPSPIGPMHAISGQ
jgi:hypothetical protein